MFFRHYASSYGLLNYPSLWNSCHIALIWFLPRMYFEMTCKITIPWKGLVTLTAVICFIRNAFCFSPKCIFKWLVKWLFLEKKANHIDCIDMFFFFIQNVFQIFRKSQFVKNAIEYLLHWYSSYPVCVLICYISWILQKSLVTLVALIRSLPSMISYIHVNGMLFAWSTLFNFCLTHYFLRMWCHNSYIEMIYNQCVYSLVL